MPETDTTFRLIVLGDARTFGRTAASPDLAKLVPGDIPIRGREDRLGMERTEWVEDFGKMRILRSVLIDAEERPGQWSLGA